MGEAAIKLEQREPILTVECDERDGSFVRSVRFTPLSPDKLRYYWERMKEYKSIFGTPVHNLEDFINTFVWQAGKDLKAGGILYEVDDVGIISIDNIVVSKMQCNAHLVFWDRKLRGREDLVRQLCEYGFEEYGFRRIVVEIPLHAMPVVTFVERVGFQKEGRLREASWYNGEWWDMFTFSLLRSDLE